MSQPAFTYNSQDLDALIKYISAERLAAYFVMAKKSLEGGIRLYERNTELSEALYGVVQGFEITLRNATHNALIEAHGITWYDKFPLLESEKDSVADAKRKIEARFETVTPGRIVAGLNFGFWVRLFSSEYDKTLWGSCLHRLVPIRLARRSVYERLKSIKTLRNRIAHHNRIIGKKQTVAELYVQTIDAIGWFSPRIKIWVETTNCFEERLSKKFMPLKKANIEAPIETEVTKEASPSKVSTNEPR